MSEAVQIVQYGRLRIQPDFRIIPRSQEQVRYSCIFERMGGLKTIYNLLDPKSEYYDSTFPKQVRLTTNRVGWSAFEINESR
ncbi:AlpA family phage regulatory protein [Klebsiella pneumoniae]